MKGILLAGGAGSRLSPSTDCISKQLLPVYDKPMVYYPLCTLMQAGVDEILLISTARDLPLFQMLLRDGAQWGLSIQYAIQDIPRGIAEAFIIAESFIANDPVCLILGDNIIYGQGLVDQLPEVWAHNPGATVFACHVADPHRYGVVEFNAHGEALSIEEKPAVPKSSYAVTGLYFYASDVAARARALRPSARGELEISDLNQHYLDEGRLQVSRFGRGVAWLDTGTHESLLQAANFIQTLQVRQRLLLGSPEEVAFKRGLIDAQALSQLAHQSRNPIYQDYLYGVLSEG